MTANSSFSSGVKFNSTINTPTLSGASSTTGLFAGEYISGTGIPAGTYVKSVDGPTQITISANATATGSQVQMNFSGSSYTGGTTISGGLVIGAVDLGCALGPVPATTAAGNVILNGGGYSYLTAVGGAGQWPATRGIEVGPTSGSGSGTIDLPNGVSVTNFAVIADNPGGTGSLTKAGQGNLILAAANTYSGGTTNNGGGTLQLDFSQSGAPTANILNSVAGGLTLGGGKFVMIGKASTVNAQTVQGVTVGGGRNYVTNIVNGATSLTFTPGAITRTAGEVDFGGTGTYSGASGALGAWATYNGLSDFAVVSGGSIAAQNSTTGIPTSGGSSSGNYYTNANTTTLTGALSANTLRLAGGTVALGANNLTIASGGGVLATANSTISGSGNLGDSASELIIQTKSGATLTNSAPLIGSGAGGLTVGGAGTLLLSSANNYTGNTTVDGGTLTIASGGSLAAGSAVKVNTGGTLTINTGGTVSGNVEIAPSTALNTANLNNSGTLSGTLTIDGAEAPVAGNPNTIGPVAPGCAYLNNGSSTAGITNNGLLGISGGATTLSNIGTITCSTGYGAIYYGSTVNNTLTLGNGSSFSFFYPQVNSVSTLQVASSGTVGISWFGYQNTATNSSCTLQNGTFNIGQIGQNNSGANFAGTVKVTNSATVNILNGGFAHGTWNVNSGTLNFYGAVSEGSAGNNIGLNLAVPSVGSSASALNILGGGLTLALGGANSTNEISSLSVNTGGTVNIGGALTLGSTTAQPKAETNSVTLADGKLLVNGAITASTGTGQTDSFSWTGGQLSALTITPSAGFNGGSSINSTTLNQTAGTLAPGDVGYSGLTTINGAYTLGSSATVAIDIGGTIVSTSFQDGNNSGRYDKIAVTGALTLGNSTLNISLINGFTPNNTDTYTIMTCGSSSGTFGNLSGGLIRLANGGSFTVTVNPTSVVLSNYQVGETWRGTTANWTDANAWRVGATPVTYANGDTVNFDDTASSGSVGVPSTVNPAAVLFNNSTLAYTLSGAGAIGGTTRVTKNGIATVSLNLANTYTGNTYINAGTLALTGSGSISSTPIIFVAGGAKFDVSGKSSTFVLQSSQTISNSPTSLATLAGNLNASAGTFAITFYPGTAPLTITSGTLTLSAGTVFNLSNLGPRLGTCALITAGLGGSVAGTPPYSTPGSITLNGGTGHLAITSGSLNLVVDSGGPAGVEPLHWTGSGSSTWDAADAGNNIWKDSTTLTPLSVYYVDGDTVRFDEQYISANQAVTLDTAVSPASTLVSNPNYNYTISGAGGIGGGGSLTKTGAGTLTLATANTYSGGTIISNGIIQMGNPTALGANGGTVLVNSGAVLDVNGTTMTALNTNVVTLNGSGPAGGGALINSSPSQAYFYGAITLGSASTINALNSTLSLMNPIAGNYPLIANADSGGTFMPRAPISGANLSIIKTGPGQLMFWPIGSPDTYGGGTYLLGGQTLAYNSTSFGTGPIYLGPTNGNGTVSMAPSAQNTTWTNPIIVMPGSSGISWLYNNYKPGVNWAGSITLSNNLQISCVNSMTISGVISGPGGVVIGRAGTAYTETDPVYFSGTNTYTGATYVSYANLNLTGHGSISNSSLISVAGGQTLDVSGLSAQPTPYMLNLGQVLANEYVGLYVNPSLNGYLASGSGTLLLTYDGVDYCFSASDLLVSSQTLVVVNPVAVLTAGSTYTLISGLDGASTLPTLQMLRGAGTLQIVGNTLQLTVTSTATPGLNEPLHWAGAGAGVWQPFTPTNLWKDSSAPAVYTAYADLDQVRFDEPFISADQVVTLNGVVTPQSIVVSNTHSYTLVGSGAIAGTGTLTKTGPGTFTLANTVGGFGLSLNTYSGATTVSNGTLMMNSTILSPVSVNGGVLSGQGTISNTVNVNAGGKLVPGTNGTTTATWLTVYGNLTLNPGSTTAVTVMGGVPAVNLINMPTNSDATYGTATYGGTLSITPAGTFHVGDSYILFQGQGATNTSNFASITGSPGAGMAFAFTNGVLSVVAQTQPNPTNITYTVTGPTSMTLNWPVGQGWLLQSNSVSLVNTSAWQTVTGATPPYPVTISPNQTKVFFRLKY
ncbi:MAG: autotransporter-associated beta strand repeat-containing protein [Verrucomicrobiota bacterium]